MNFRSRGSCQINIILGEKILENMSIFFQLYLEDYFFF